MIRVLSELSRLNSISNLGKVVKGEINFNTTLPISIKVKEQVKSNLFMLDIGRKEQIQTKSELPLDVGKKYWGILKQEPKSKSVSISNLFIQPKILQSKLDQGNLRFDIQTLKNVLESNNPKETIKQNLLHQLSTATSKEQFLLTTNLLNALQDNLFSFVLTHNQKETFFQFKKQKSKKREKKDQQDDNQNGSIEFYAAFENLGPLEGVVELIDGISHLTIYLFYENSLEFLKNELKNLSFETNLYKKKGKIYPLYEYGNSLLDLKG
ncbi:MAG: hypothetical protein DSZ06_04340 [Sulfurospirillum sp.]|nr:MAG: hypothetical protein DSZ06_04340 [Sulfurospirillum sp.]